MYRNAVDTFLKPGALRHDNADADVEAEMAQSVFREASGIWLRCVDKQLSLMLGRPGLSSIEYDESWEKMHPLDWPKMWAHPDQGSDGQCAASFLRGKHKPCNLALRLRGHPCHLLFMSVDHMNKAASCLCLPEDRIQKNKPTKRTPTERVSN